MGARSTTSPGRFFPLAIFGVLTLAAALRLWGLDHPAELVFDELYYVRDAITQLAHGYPTDWPDDDPLLGTRFLATPEFAVHPPLGKWLIGLGLLVFGTDTGWGWRSAAAVCGVLTVALTMRLGWRISRSAAVTVLAGLLLAVDGVHVVLSRVSLLDGFLTTFVALGALLMWRDHEWVVDRSRRSLGNGRALPVLLWRPWLIAAALAFGGAAAVKWSGLYPLAAFLILTTVRDLIVRLRWQRARGLRDGGRAGATLAVLRAALQAIATALTALPIALASYVASWAGWITTSGGWGRSAGPWWQGLWKYHVDMFAWHSTLSAPHPYAAHPLTWPLGLVPTAMYREDVGGRMEAISSIPNPFVTWAGVAALLTLCWWLVQTLITAMRARRTPRLRIAGLPQLTGYGVALVLVGYLSGWLPWVLTVSRSAVFQFYAVVLTPFAALALALVLGALLSAPGAADERFGKRTAVWIFVVATVIVGLLFFPIWSGLSEPPWFWRWHMWLPAWA